MEEGTMKHEKSKWKNREAVQKYFVQIHNQ